LLVASFGRSTGCFRHADCLSLFPLWLGYILTVDALVSREPAVRSGRGHAGILFCCLCFSAIWWLFESINENAPAIGNTRAANTFNRLQILFLVHNFIFHRHAAVFETAELVRSFAWSHNQSRRPPPVHGRVNVSLLLTGGSSPPARADLACRKRFIRWSGCRGSDLEPFNFWLRRDHCPARLDRGDWRPIISLSMGALICGFFWECGITILWPKWVTILGARSSPHIRDAFAGLRWVRPFALELFA